MRRPRNHRSIGPIRKYLVALLLTIPIVANAQEKGSSVTWHSTTVQFGWNQLKDENLHPKVSSGIITELSYGFEKRNSALQEFHFTLGYSRLKTQLEDLSKTANLALNTGYSRSFLLSSGKRISYYLGPEIYLGYNVCYFPNWDDSHLYWANHLSLGVRNVVVIPMNEKNEWVTSFSFPLFSVYSRPDPQRLYKIDRIDVGGIAKNLHSHIQAAHLVNVIYAFFQTEYRFPIFGNKVESFSYSFDFLRVKQDAGNPFQQLIHQLGLHFYL